MSSDTKQLVDELTKRITDEIGRRFDEHDLKWDKRLADRDGEWDRKLTDLKESQDQRVVALEQAAGSFDEWHSEIEATIDDIRLEVKKINKHYERTALEQPTSSTGILAPSPAAAWRPSAGDPTAWPSGHRFNSTHREDDHGVVTTMVHPPVKGAYPDHTQPVSRNSFTSDVRGDGSRGQYGRWPKIDFPSFDGDNPKLWISRCEDYFDFCNIDPSMWVRLSSMHFSEIPSRWLQSVEKKVRTCNWAEFCALLLERFGRDQHELLVRQLFHIRQTGSMSDYIERFATLMD